MQYRPLFSDDLAAVGQAAYYRVTARNSAGQSAPSNVVGPVTANAPHAGGRVRKISPAWLTTWAASRLHSDNVRRTQEDSHRIVLAPGAAIEYRVDAPISAWRVYAFAESPNPELSFAGSTDGNTFSPLSTDHRAFSSGQGDYGYLVPVLFQGRSPAAVPASVRSSSASSCLQPSKARSRCRSPAWKSTTAGKSPTERI